MGLQTNGFSFDVCEWLLPVRIIVKGMASRQCAHHMALHIQYEKWLSETHFRLCRVNAYMPTACMDNLWTVRSMGLKPLCIYIYILIIYIINVGLHSTNSQTKNSGLTE